MPKDTALNPVVTQAGGAQNVQLTPVTNSDTALDPVVRQWSGTQTVAVALAT